MMDLAVGVIIGGAFGKITTSLVDDVIMPAISAVIGDVDFSNMLILLAEVPEGTAMTYTALKEAGVPVLVYGNFIAILINFIILAFIVFLLVKGIKKCVDKPKQSQKLLPSHQKRCCYCVRLAKI